MPGYNYEYGDPYYYVNLDEDVKTFLKDNLKDFKFPDLDALEVKPPSKIEESVRLYDGTYTSIKNVDKKFFKCAVTDEYYPNSMKRVIRTRPALHRTFRNVFVNEDYFKECKQCPKTKSYYKVKDFGEDYLGNFISVEALQSYIRCNDCGKYFPDSSHFDSEFISICKTCVEKRLEAPYLWCPDFYRYNANVITCILGEESTYIPPKKSLVMGLEIEQQVNFQTRSEFKQYVENIYDHLGRDYIIVKHDGSLNKGLEIVTMPRVLNEHLLKWESFFTIFSNCLGVYGDGVGLHVHVNKKALSSLTIGKIQAFLNSTYNRDFILDIAGRHCPEYSAFVDNAKVTYKPSSRYVVLNITRNTIEFRFFKSPKSFKKLAQRLEFVKSLIEFCEYTSLRNLTFDDYLKYLEDTKYTNLKKYFS